MTGGLVANVHFLNRLVALAETVNVEAAEDIAADNGALLVAKGARIDRQSRERLLERKLSKPIEGSVRVVADVGPRRLGQLAEALLDQHALIADVCGDASARLVAQALRDLRLSAPMESLLGLYAAQGASRLDHAVGVGLLSAAMWHGLPEGDSSRGLRTMMLAGLMHDVGELHVDPACLQPGRSLTFEQWKHLAAHPIVGAHVLCRMAGAGPGVAEAVLYHHERLDGFGYPHGLRTGLVPLSGQVLALAEMLMGLIESGGGASERASVAIQLVPGEFNHRLLDRVARAARTAGPLSAAEKTPSPSAEELATMANALGGALQPLRDMRPGVRARVRAGSLALQSLVAHMTERCRRIGLALASTGLDTRRGPLALRERLATMNPRTHFEVVTLLREVDWRLREVEREARLRAEYLPTAEAELVRGLIERSQCGARTVATAEPAC